MPLSSGTRLGPYEILAPLGAGGMGEVYRAKDPRLSRDVALKVLPEDFFESEERRQRFEREARLLASLNHPGIAVVYSFEEIPGSSSSSSSSSTSSSRHILTMELLEGETLRSALDRGPVPVKRTLDIAAQLADALASAHEKDIVHRDVKPENVFLTKEGRAKLLDFGIARQRPPAAPADTVTPTITVVSEPGVLVGTVAYMSPEQARGGIVDFRSDQFSLGVVLYEMLAGKRPFGGATPTDTLAAILRDEPEPLDAAANVSEPVRLLVERCLAKETTGRYESTRDLARELGTWKERSSGVSSEGQEGRGGIRRPRTRRRTVLSFAVAAAAVALAAVAALVVRSRATSPITATGKAPGLDPKRIAVAPFENRTGDPSLEPVSKMAAEWITEGLSGIRIDVVPSADVFDAPVAKDAPKDSARESSRKLAERTGAGIVVSGAFYLEGPDVRLQSQVSDVAAGKLLRAFPPASASRTNPMPAVDAVRRQVRDLLGVHLGARGGEVLGNETTPPRYEAYLEYLLAQEKVASDSAAAEAHYRKALELDPEFVSARSFLVGILTLNRRFAEADRELAFLEERRSRLSPMNRYVVEGQRALLDGRYDDAVTANRSVVRLSPGDPEALFELATFALKASRPAEAVEALTRPVRWDVFLSSSRSWSSVYFSALCQGYHVLGRHEEELAAARRGRAMFPSKGPRVTEELKALVALGRLDEADRLIADTLARTELAKGIPGFLMEASAELGAHGHPAEARKMAERCAAEASTKSVKAHCLCIAGRWAEAVPVFQELEKEAPRLDPLFRGFRALAAYRAGDVATASKIEDDLRRLERPYLFGEHLFFLSGLAAQRGEKERAVSLLREALQQGYTNNVEVVAFTAHRRWYFEPFRGYPPFEVLIRPKG